MASLGHNVLNSWRNEWMKMAVSDGIFKYILLNEKFDSNFIEICF